MTQLHLSATVGAAALTVVSGSVCISTNTNNKVIFSHQIKYSKVSKEASGDDVICYHAKKHACSEVLKV